MSSSLDYLELCRLCLVKDRVSVPIFEDEGDVRQIFLKITACLPVKVSREDKLPKKICDDCVYKVELFYQFWNTTANAEKQLLQWLGEVGGLEDKPGYVTEVLDTNVMKQETSSDSRLDGSVMQVGGHQNNMDMGMMDIITMPAGSEQQFTSVPMDTGGTVQTVQVVPGPSTQTTHDQMAQSQTSHLVGEESEEENSDDGCDNEEGLPVKEENDDHGDQPLETTFVALPCDEAGPSGLQQQKISELSEMSMQQTADNDPKTGTKRARGCVPRILQRNRQAKDSTSDSEQEVSQKTTKKRLVIATTTKKNTTSRQSVLKSMYVKPFTQEKERLSSSTLDDTEDSSKNVDLPTLITRSVPREVHQCDSCDESFHDRSALIIHKTEKSIVRTREALREPPVKINCEMCNRQFSYKGVLERHYRHCGVVNQEEVGIKPRRRRTPAKLTKTDKENEGTEEGPVSCDKCGKVFKKEKYLKAHTTMSHSDHIVCQFCDVKIETVTLLRSHMAEMHSEEYTEFCSICNKGFFSRQSLKVHVTAHARDGKLNYCDICGKGFRHKVYLEKHVQHVHVEMQDRKKYQCDFCTYETQYKNVFREHVYKHTREDQVQCDICNKRMRKSYMKIHLRIHSGYKPEVCEFCGKAFTARKYLLKHRVVHTGEKPYECRLCEKRYTQRGTLTLHMRKKHQPDIENGEGVTERDEEEVDTDILDQFVEVSEDGAVVELAKEKDIEEYQLIDNEDAESEEGEVFEMEFQKDEEGELVDGDGKVVYVQEFADERNEIVYKMTNECGEIQSSNNIIICEVENDADADAAEVVVSDFEEIVEDAEGMVENDKKGIKSEESEMNDEGGLIYEVPVNEADDKVVTVKDENSSDESIKLEMLSDNGAEYFEEFKEEDRRKI